LVLVACACGCGPEDTERLARVGHKIAARAEALTADADGKLSRGWQAVHGDSDEPALEARVAARLRWDKELADTPIQVTAVGGVVELKGTVRDSDKRQRAVGLAQSTAGVEKVKDALSE
jgi:osmotically-inducible protein OsmY